MWLTDANDTNYSAGLQVLLQPKKALGTLKLESGVAREEDVLGALELESGGALEKKVVIT